MPQDMFQAVEMFNRDALGNPIPDRPTLLTGEQIARYRQAVNEELDELEHASTIADQLDALHDLNYFTCGRVAELGCASIGLETFMLVHEANMRKRGGTLAKRNGWKGNDAVKPDGWTPPDFSEALSRLGVSPHLGRGIPSGRPKVLVLGHARHGKDTVCEMLRDIYGFSFRSSSMFLAENVLLPHFNRHSTGHAPTETPMYANAQECYDDRHNHRAEWFAVIEAYNKPGHRLASEMQKAGIEVHCGMRSKMEFDACMAESLFDAVVWVDRSDYVGPEDASSCTVTPDMTRHHIDNNGSLEDLRQEVGRFVNKVLKAGGVS